MFFKDFIYPVRQQAGAEKFLTDIILKNQAGIFFLKDYGHTARNNTAISPPAKAIKKIVAASGLFLFPAVDGAKNEQEGIVNFNEDD